MANKRLGEDKLENANLSLPIWLNRHIRELGGPQKVLLPLILPHFKKEEIVSKKSD